MKSVATLIIALFCSLSVFATEHENQNIFGSFPTQRIKIVESFSKGHRVPIFLRFSNQKLSRKFRPSILIEIPNCDFDACFLGDLLIELEIGRKIKLQELAFRLIDISEEKKSYESELLTYESQHKKALKTDKLEKANPRP